MKSHEIELDKLLDMVSFEDCEYLDDDISSKKADEIDKILDGLLNGDEDGESE